MAGLEEALNGTEGERGAEGDLDRDRAQPGAIQEGLRGRQASLAVGGEDVRGIRHQPRLNNPEAIRLPHGDG